MSTILKALRRLEDKKAAAAERPLRDEVVVSTGRRRGRGGLASAIAAGVALAFTGLVLLWALDPESDFDAPVPASSEPAVSAAPEPAPPEDPYAETAPSAEASEDAGAPDFEIVRPDPTAAPRPLSPPPLPRLEDEGEPPLETARRQPVARAAPPPVEPAPAREAIDPELPVYEEEPFYEEQKREVVVAKPSASVRVARTQWHPDPDRRIAWVEVQGSVAMREVREGERVGPYVVREIEPASVLFADGAVEVRREVGR
jgi:hypothetical protein